MKLLENVLLQLLTTQYFCLFAKSGSETAREGSSLLLTYQSVNMLRKQCRWVWRTIVSTFERYLNTSDKDQFTKKATVEFPPTIHSPPALFPHIKTDIRSLLPFIFYFGKIGTAKEKAQCNHSSFLFAKNNCVLSSVIFITNNGVRTRLCFLADQPCNYY